jgi:putative phosphoribosyl transferase
MNNGIEIPIGQQTLRGELIIPEGATGLTIFVHGSGSGRYSPRNQFVAAAIRRSVIGTLLFDLLTEDEEAIDDQTRHLRFDIDMLAQRLVAVTKWVETADKTHSLAISYFGASTGAAAALVAAAEMGLLVRAVVSRGGRPDLAGDALPKVVSPVMLIVGGYDKSVIEMNETAYAQLKCVKDFRIVPRASHLFSEPGTLETAAHFAADWLSRYLPALEMGRKAKGA